MVILVVGALSCIADWTVWSLALEAAEEADTLETTDETIPRSTALANQVLVLDSDRRPKRVHNKDANARARNWC